jgi:dTDP-4-dehydrorhamnose 3,5-epimerase
MTTTTKSLAIPAVKLIASIRHTDERGSFCETWNRRDLEGTGIACDFVQDNHVASDAAGTIRGLHYQSVPFAQGKLLRVARGRIFDVAVDLRPGSDTLGQWVGKELDCRTGEQIWIPAGFAHGYCTLEPQTEVVYKVDAYYHPAAEGGIRWDDPDLGIDWPALAADPVVSPKDQALPAFADWLLEAVDRLDQVGLDDYDELKKTKHTPSRSERASI